MIRATVLVGAVALVFSASALSRDTKHLFPIAEALDGPAAQEKLNPEIKFYFAGEKTPKIARTIVEAVSNRKTSAFKKSDQEACNWVFLSALIAFQDRAIQEGGDAVVEIESYYKKNSYRSSTEFECHAGAIMAGVALKGKVVKLSP